MMIYVDSKKLPPIVAARLRDRNHKAAYWTGEVSDGGRDAFVVDVFGLDAGSSPVYGGGTSVVCLR